jgi:ribosomal protein RSM22 (predicted rRNA methylase)
VAAYLAYRAPATFAAAAAVFRQVALQRPEWRPRSVLDVGAGTGAATWAALEQWPSLAELTLVEVEPAMLDAGRELLPDASWVAGNVEAARGPADLVLCSYVLGELANAAGAALHLWDQAADAVAFVEPGTPAGYRRVLDARAAVLAAGGHTVAPCPHDLPCPLPADDWCHFAARLPRSKLHRRAKGADLGWEDEKFSYAVLSREPVSPAAARIIRRPVARSGYVELVTSDADGAVRERRVAKSAGAAYKQARKAGWGDALDVP